MKFNKVNDMKLENLNRANELACLIENSKHSLETIDALMEVPAIEITATNTANCYYVIVRDADLRERILNSVKAHYEAKIDEYIKELGTL